MLSNRISRIQRLSARYRRYSSDTQTTYPFTKLKAYPFRLSPEDATLQLAPYASLVSSFQNFFGSLGARYLPGFGFEPIRPVQITPVYFPGWFIDAEVSADFKFANVKQSRASGVTINSYLPGSDFRVLSWVSQRLEEAHDLVSFTEELTRQHGVDVTCIPYTISPFAGLELAQCATDPIQLRDDISVIPSSIHSGMFAAYPVLFPLYLAQYRISINGGEQLLTMFIQAATPDGRIWSERLDPSNAPQYGPQFLFDIYNDLTKEDVYCLRGDIQPFFTFGLNFPERGQADKMVNGWLNSAITLHGAGPELVNKTGTITSDADPRIRPFTAEERMTVQKWLELNNRVELYTNLAKTLRQASSEYLPISQSQNTASHIPKGVESVERTITQIKAERDAATPLWWKEWQCLSESKQP